MLASGNNTVAYMWLGDPITIISKFIAYEFCLNVSNYYVN